MIVYFDTSALVSLWCRDSHFKTLDKWLVDAGPRLIISDFGRAEFISALSQRIRVGLLSQPDAIGLIGELDVDDPAVTKVEIESRDLALAAEYVMHFDLALRAPDALHLAVCRRLGATLVTFDERQHQGARSLSIPVVDFAVSA